MAENLAMDQSQPVRIALVTTHPIQYQVPWFRELHKLTVVDFKVFYGILPDAQQQSTGFAQEFSWDIPLLDGYEWALCDNVSREAGVDRYSACDCPEIGSNLAEFHPDIVIITGWQSRMLVQAARAARKQGARLILRGDSNALKPRPWWVRLIHKVYFRKFDAFLSVGKANRDFYLANGVAERKIFEAPHFVENARFSSIAAGSDDEASDARAVLRRHLGIPEDAFCFLYCGKLVVKKHVSDLLGAMGLLTGKPENIHLLIVGSGDLELQLKNQVEAGNLPVTFAGFVNQVEIPSMYRAADCLLLASDYGETWGLVVNEAMACGLPAIVSDRVGCGPDLVKPGETGYIYPFGDCENLAVCMEAMSANPTEAIQMGLRAQSLVLEKYYVGRSVDAVVDSTRLLIGESGVDEAHGSI